MSDVDPAPAGAIFPRSVVVSSVVLLVVLLLLVAIILIPAIGRARTGSAILRLEAERSRDYWAIADSLIQSKETLGRFPNSIDEWSALDMNVPELLRAPFGAPSGYKVDFGPLIQGETGVVVLDPGLDLEDSGVPWGIDWSYWTRAGINFVHTPSGNYPFEIQSAR
jgi:hypothetical protein